MEETMQKYLKGRNLDEFADQLTKRMAELPPQSEMRDDIVSAYLHGFTVYTEAGWIVTQRQLYDYINRSNQVPEMSDDDCHKLHEYLKKQVGEPPTMYVPLPVKASGFEPNLPIDCRQRPNEIHQPADPNIGEEPTLGRHMRRRFGELPNHDPTEQTLEPEVGQEQVCNLTKLGDFRTEFNPSREAIEESIKGANEVQVGGDHYRKIPGEQLWDRLVRLYGFEYARVFFVGNILGYVERYRDKDGIKDLEKAKHYIQKLIELENEHGIGKKEGGG